MRTRNMAVKTSIPDLGSVTAEHKATWEDGDYACFAIFTENAAIEILDKRIIPIAKI